MPSVAGGCGGEQEWGSAPHPLPVTILTKKSSTIGDKITRKEWKEYFVTSWTHFLLVKNRTGAGVVTQSHYHFPLFLKKKIRKCSIHFQKLLFFLSLFNFWKWLSYFLKENEHESSHQTVLELELAVASRIKIASSRTVWLSCWWLVRKSSKSWILINLSPIVLLRAFIYFYISCIIFKVVYWQLILK